MKLRENDPTTIIRSMADLDRLVGDDSPPPPPSESAAAAVGSSSGTGAVSAEGEGVSDGFIPVSSGAKKPPPPPPGAP